MDYLHSILWNICCTHQGNNSQQKIFLQILQKKVQNLTSCTQPPQTQNNYIITHHNNKYNPLIRLDKKMHGSRTRTSADLQAQQLSNRMRMGTGVNTLIKAQNAPTHHMDCMVALEQFRKDYASYDREQREREIARKQMEIERKRLEYLERENQRWEKVETQFNRKKEREYSKAYSQMMGQKRTANSNGLAYNPINLSYDSNAQGEKLKRKDQDRQIRRYVRARNMDDRGNGKYDLISGKPRAGIEQIIPEALGERYGTKLAEHYEGLKLKVPAEDGYSSPRNRYF